MRARGRASPASFENRASCDDASLFSQRELEVPLAKRSHRWSHIRRRRALWAVRRERQLATSSAQALIATLPGGNTGRARPIRLRLGKGKRPIARTDGNKLGAVESAAAVVAAPTCPVAYDIVALHDAHRHQRAARSDTNQVARPEPIAKSVSASPRRGPSDDSHRLRSYCLRSHHWRRGKRWRCQRRSRVLGGSGRSRKCSGEQGSCDGGKQSYAASIA